MLQHGAITLGLVNTQDTCGMHICNQVSVSLWAHDNTFIFMSAPLTKSNQYETHYKVGLQLRLQQIKFAASIGVALEFHCSWEHEQDRRWWKFDLTITPQVTPVSQSQYLIVQHCRGPCQWCWVHHSFRLCYERYFIMRQFTVLDYYQARKLSHSTPSLISESASQWGAL